MTERIGDGAVQWATARAGGILPLTSFPVTEKFCRSDGGKMPPVQGVTARTGGILPPFSVVICGLGVDGLDDDRHPA